MNKLGDFYTDFSRIDLDTRGGYARVAQVKTKGQLDIPKECAFKLMRHEIDYQKGVERFEDELRVLSEITNDSDSPSAITRIYDSGFVPIELSQSLHERKMPDPGLEFVSTGTDSQKFLEMKSTLWEEPGRWIPFLVVELAPYDDSLLRQVRQQPTEDPSGLYRLPTGEVLGMSIQLLDVMKYLHSTKHRAYMDWKPEHIFWNGLNRQVKLIDWNVTTSLDDGPGERQNIRDDIRLFCGAVMYIGLTFVDPDDPAMPIGPRPTTKIISPVSEVRRRYWTDNPDFYQRGSMLDDKIKQLICRGLNPDQGFDSPEELKLLLTQYASEELGLIDTDHPVSATPKSLYFQALLDIRQAQKSLLDAQERLIEVTELHGESLEFTRLSKVIKRALTNFPIS